MIKVLDHGFVRAVDVWGGGEHSFEDMECGIIEAARQSTQGSFRGWDRDASLLRHLYEHKHATPFEFAGLVIEVKAPLFVFREWQRHRTQSYNEMSARYAPVPNEHYIPSVKRLRQTSDDGNKQAGKLKDSEDLTIASAEGAVQALREFCQRSDDHYQAALNAGVPKELARCFMLVNRYSQMRASANLRNWLAFLTLRMAPDAQWEIRQYANAVGQIIAEHFPQTWSLFSQERRSR